MHDFWFECFHVVVFFLYFGFLFWGWGVLKSTKWQKITLKNSTGGGGRGMGLEGLVDPGLYLFSPGNGGKLLKDTKMAKIICKKFNCVCYNPHTIIAIRDVTENVDSCY